MGPDHMTGYVRQHLRDRGVIAQSSDGLNIESSPGAGGKAVTYVRRAVDRPRWERPFRAVLLKNLLDLPDAEVRPSPSDDQYTIVWEVPA